MNTFWKKINLWKVSKNIFSWIETKVSALINNVKKSFSKKVTDILDQSNQKSEKQETQESINKLPCYKNIVGYTNSKGVDFAVFIDPQTKKIEHIFTVTKNKAKQTPCRFQKEIIEQRWADQNNLRKYFTRIRKTDKQKQIIEYAIEHKNNPTPEYIPGKTQKNKPVLSKAKNPDFKWKYSYVNSQWRRFKFIAENGKIIHIVAEDKWTVHPSQKWAIQKIINNKIAGKFKELVPPEKTSNETNQEQTTLKQIIPATQDTVNETMNLSESIHRINKKAEENIEREISLNLDYKKLEKEIGILFKYNPNKKPTSEEKKAATALLEQLSKKIPKRKNDHKIRDQEDTMKILFEAIQEYTQCTWWESKKTESKRSALFSAFVSAKYAFMNSMKTIEPKHYEETWFVYNA